MHAPHSTGEEGVAVVTVALWLPLLVLFVSFAIDVGNWFLHDRHLQLQADAGALAAGGDFSFSCDDAEVEATARQYSGTDEAGGGYNHQVGGTPPEEVHFELNSATYFDQPSPIDETVAGPPCEAGMVDVKLTETDLPLFFQVLDAFDAVPFINAHARVEIFEKRSIRGALPVAVPDTNPRRARATFVDEETGAVLASTELIQSESSEGLAIWDNVAEPLPVTVDREQIGVRIALSGGTSTTCGDPLVECYDAGSEGGILYARGWSASGSDAQPAAPLARDAYLLAGSCDPYFSSEESGCSVGLHAEVDFGPCEDIGEVGAELTAVAGGSSYPLTMSGCPEGTSTSSWETSGTPIPVPVGAGPVPIELEWAETKGEQGGNECKEGGGNKCKGSFGVVQRSFAGDEESSGPIRSAQIWEGGGLWANSFERCSAVQAECTHSLVVRIGIDQSLQENAETGEEPPVALRVFHEASNNPSQNQSLDCDPDIPNLREEIAFGCAPEYAVNAGTACPSPAALWESPEPWECSAIQTGGAVNQVFQGMNLRVHGSTGPSECVSPNDWPSFPGIDAGDPRLVPVFLTAFGSFSGSGNDTVPVTGFATFYATGWAGQGGGNSSDQICSGALGETPDDPADSGTIVGHFVKYVQAFNDGSAGEETCDFDSTTPCVAVLTE